MDKSVETLLESLEHLADDAKQEAASEILKRSVKFELPPFDKDIFLRAANNVFIELDNEESRYEKDR